ncbi:MAG: HAD hydrolase family protein [Planctomycetota bacterium]|nr:HAD hydrolase family protein [Planctomycetota bacterium]
MKPEIPNPIQVCQPQLLVLDVDGVLTDNSLWMSADGTEWKQFHVPDGAGIRWLLEAGIGVALISGRESTVTRQRAHELGIEEVHTGIADKAACLEQLLERTGVAARNTVYVGDDLIDLPPMSMVGVSVAVANSRPQVLEQATVVTGRSGGQGAVREVCEWILVARGLWQQRSEQPVAGEKP